MSAVLSDVCRFVSQAVYEGRLESTSECGAQHIASPGKLTGTGVRYVPVEHEGNTRSSPEETQAIAGLVEDLLKGRYAKADPGEDGGDTDRIDLIRPEDIMVVAPYNAQVRCLREHLSDGVQLAPSTGSRGRRRRCACSRWPPQAARRSRETWSSCSAATASTSPSPARGIWRCWCLSILVRLQVHPGRRKELSLDRFDVSLGILRLRINDNFAIL